MPRSIVRRHAAVWLPIVLASFVRIGIGLANWGSPFLETPLIDARDFHAKALLVAAGEPLPDRPYDRPPLLVYVAGGLYRVFGTDPRVVVVAHHVLGVACVGLVAWLGRRWFSPLAGGLAGTLFALAALPVALESQVLNEPIQTFLLLVTMLLLTRVRDGAGVRGLFAAALTAALAILARPTSALFVVPALAYVAWVSAKDGRRTAAAGALVLFLVVSSLAAVRNARTTGEFVPVSYNGGINFFIGNGAHADALIDIRPGLLWDRLVQTPRALEETGVFRQDPWAAGVAAWDERYWSAAMADIRTDPVAALVRVARKAAQFWSARDIDRNVPLSVFLPVPLLPFAVLGPLALAGTLLWLVRRPAKWAWPAGLVLSVWITCAVFFVTSRYRMPAYPALALAAGYWVWVVVAARGRDRVAWIVFALALAFGVTDVGGARHIRGGRPDFLRGVALEESGRPEEALAAYRDALEADPEDADANFRPMSILMRIGRVEEAARLGERAARFAPDHPLPLFNLGLAYASLGRLEEAREVFRRMTEVAPNDPRGHYQLGRLLTETGDPSAALPSLDRAERLAPDVPLTHLERARALVALDRTAEAREALSRALRRDPGLGQRVEEDPVLRSLLTPGEDG